MKIDSALKEFSEKYDEVAMQYIESVSNEFGLIQQRSTIKGFNINEAFEEFGDFITKYAKYKIENMDNPKATPQSMICQRVDKNIKENIFKESSMLYNKIPSFIETYITGIKKLDNIINESKRLMIESGVDQKSIGDINTFTDTFMETLHESFNPTMNRILTASGYFAKKKLYGNSDNKTKAVFL